jgi:PKD repeat protein
MKSPRLLTAVSPLLLLVPSLSIRAATYMPMSDADLFRLANVVVVAEVVDATVRLDRDGDEELPFTVVTLRRLEGFKGDLDETFRVVVPGGVAGGITWALPGTPDFDAGQQVVLALNPLPGRSGEYGLSEFGLSKFDIVSDAAGRRFAVRPVFGAREDLELSRMGYLAPVASLAAAPGATLSARDAESFLAALRTLRGVGTLPAVAYACPAGDLEPRRAHLLTKWANLGGVELGNCGGQPCLFKWFWENGGSPDATLFLTGSQTRLVANYAPCGLDQACLAQKAVDNWHGIANTDVHLSKIASMGNLEVLLDQDVAHNGTTWTTPYDCTNGGAVGIGGPTSQTAARTFKGLTPYYPAGTGKVSMRRWTCDYQTSVFIEVLTHETGHVLGLNHPDQYQSVHSTTTPADWDAAVMRSQAHNPSTLVPQADDIQAMQFYYGTTPPGPVPAANFTVSPTSPSAGSPVTFTDTTSNSPTGWLWFFGEPSSGSNFSRDRNPTHTYAGPGTYTVDLIAGSLNGGSRATKQITVGGAIQPCVAGPATLCLNNNRFKVEVDWRVPSQNRSGQGMAVPLTGDTGYFWFFNSANVELVIKTLDARGVNGKFWVFYGALSTVEYTITVTDTVTGAVKPYFNASGNLASVADTAAFQPVSTGPLGEGPAPSVSEEDLAAKTAEELYAMYAVLSEARPPEGLAPAAGITAPATTACVPGATALCLNQSRFQVRVNWEVPSQGRSGEGMAVPVTSDTGYFWFFTNTNVELIIKVLDARGVNGHYWVFYGALSTVKYTITVTDTQTGAVRPYENPSGNLASVADTSAF